MATQNFELIGTLKKLFNTCIDAENGFRIAVDHTKDARLKALYRGYAEQRAQFAAELQGELERLGAHDGKHGTVGGALHQGWAKIKSAATSDSDKVLLAECERGEDVAKQAYTEALQHELPTGVQLLVQRQFAGVREAHDHIRALESATRLTGQPGETRS